MLFFETMLSRGGRRSCGTCHKPALLFMDGLSRAWGLHDMELRRKTPGLLNVGWQRSMFSDGRVKTLEEQAPKPLENHLEMDLDPEVAAERVANDPVYQKLFERVFPGQAITFDLIAKAIAAYERTLVSYDSDFDRYLLGDHTALEPEAVRGMDLFTGKAGCVGCHNGPLLTDHQFHYTGVPEIPGGTPNGTKHKTQGLRDVNRRSSYMHNGHYLKLRHVIDHYARGGAAPDGERATPDGRGRPRHRRRADGTDGRARRHRTPGHSSAGTARRAHPSRVPPSAGRRNAANGSPSAWTKPVTDP